MTAPRCRCGHKHAEHRGRFARGTTTSCDACLTCHAYRPTDGQATP